MIKARLKHATIGQPAYGLNVPASEYTDEGVRLLRTTDISDDGQLAEEVGPVFVDARVAMEGRLREGDLLISRSGTVGRSYLHDGAIAATYAGYLVRFRPRSGVMPRFLFYWTKSKGFADQVQLEGTQSTIVNVNAQKYANMSLPLPPITAQRAITDFLDRETQRIDRLMEKKRRLIELLEEKRTALISHAVTKGLDPTVPMKDSGIPWLGEIPAHWDARPLKALVSKIGSGKTPRGGSTSYVDAGVTFIRSQNVHFGGLRLDDVVYISTDIDAEMAGTRVRPGDVLLNITGASLGRCCVVLSDDLRANVNQHVSILRPIRKSVSPGWLAYALESRPLQEQIWATQGGAAREGLNSFATGRLRLPVCSIGEQEKIASFLDEKTALMAAALSRLEAQLDTLGEYRQALITAAVTGQIDVTIEAPEPEEVIA